MHLHPVRVHRYHSTDVKKLHCIILVTATEPAGVCGGQGAGEDEIVVFAACREEMAVSPDSVQDNYDV